MRPQDVLQSQLRLKEALGDPRIHQSTAEYLDRFTETTDSINDVRTKREGFDIISGREFCRRVDHHLERSLAFHVSADMIPVVEYAAKGLQAEEAFEESTFPTYHGFLEFETPVDMPNFFGDVVTVKYLSWYYGKLTYPSRENLHFDGTTDYLRDVEKATFWLQSFDAEFNLVRLDAIPTGHTIGRQHEMKYFQYPREKMEEAYRELEELERKYEDLLRQHPDRAEEIKSLEVEDFFEPGTNKLDVLVSDQVLAQAVMLAYSLKAWHFHQEQLKEIIWESRANNPLRFYFSMFTMMNQTIIEVEKPRLTPKRQAYWRKKRIPGDVTIIRLRRRVHRDKGDQESLVEWSHRWVVRGHWRKQPFGPGRQDHKLIWISPHVKGPEGLPFKQSQKVYSFSR